MFRGFGLLVLWLVASFGLAGGFWTLGLALLGFIAEDFRVEGLGF